MLTSQATILLRHIQSLIGEQPASPLSDRELLHRFCRQRDEAAFATLLQRHGPMVFSVCRSALRQPQDVDDAFQVTFLVLLRKAATHRWHESIGGWLHAVAGRIARRIQVESARHAAGADRTRELSVPDPLEQMTARELLSALHECLAQLPETYRSPLVACYLEGKTQEEAARQLGCSLSTLRRRLDRGRQLLHGRLARRGLTLAAALGVVPLGKTSASALPALPARAIIHAVGVSASGAALTGIFSPRVAALADEVVRAASLGPLKTATAWLLALSVVAAGAGLAARQVAAPQPPETGPQAQAEPRAAGGTREKQNDQESGRSDRYGDPLPAGALLRLGTLRFRHPTLIGPVAFSPVGGSLAVGGYNGDIRVYSLDTGKEIRRFQADASQFPAIAFSPTGKRLAGAGFNTIRIWDADTGKELRRFEADVAGTLDLEHIVPLVFSSDGKALAWVAPDRSVRVWETETGNELGRLAGHQNPVRCLAFSLDGKTLFSASGDGVMDGSVRSWELATGKEQWTRRLRGSGEKGNPGRPLAFSPDGKMLAFEAHEILRRQNVPDPNILDWQVISLLDLATGEVRRRLEPHRGRFKAAAFAMDGQSIVTMNAEPSITRSHTLSEDINRIKVWDVTTGRQRFDFPGYADHHGFRSPGTLAFAPDGKRIAATGSGPAVHVWDLAGGREHLEKPDTHHQAIRCIAFAPDGRTVASASSDHSIALWDAVTGRQRLRLHGHESTVAHLAFSPDGKLLASASHDNDQTVRLWELATGKELKRHVVPSEDNGDGSFTGVGAWIGFTLGGKVLAAAGTDCKIRLWDVATGKELLDQRIHRRGAPVMPRPKFTDSSYSLQIVREIAFTGDGNTAALATAQAIEVADVATGQRLFRIMVDGGVDHLALSPDGKTLAYAGRVGMLRLVEVASGQDVQKLDPIPEVLALAFASDGRSLAVAAGRAEPNIHLFDVRTRKKLLSLAGLDSCVRTLAFSPDGQRLASGQQNSTALIWDLSPGIAVAKPPTYNLGRRDLNQLWDDLKGPDAKRAHAALWTLVTVPDMAIPFLRERLRPAPPVGPDRIGQLIANLDAEQFAVREEASKELARLGIEAEPALRRALAGKLSLEMRRRVEGLLVGPIPQTEIAPEALCQLRAIQVLEQIGSLDAQHILESLAQGAPAAPATRDAKAALERLAKRH